MRLEWIIYVKCLERCLAHSKLSIILTLYVRWGREGLDGDYGGSERGRGGIWDELKAR